MSNTKYIAIVDDHTMFRKGLRALIDFFPGYKVLFDAANGKDFIKQLKTQSPPRHITIGYQYARNGWLCYR